jgi:hydrogenase maturation protease
MMAKRILIAGIGNIFLGDDGFGVEAAQQLMRCTLPEEVHVADFGIRSYDLAYAIMDGYEAVILVDATQQGHPPGTLYLIEPDLHALEELDGEVVNAHSMNPVRVLHLVNMLGGHAGKVYLVGCEPAILETEDGYIGLSIVARAAVPKAVEMVESLVRNLLRERIEPSLGPAYNA